MQYIVGKKFQGKILDGYYYVLLIGALCECKDNIIYHNNKSLFYKTSQNAYDYLARNDDNKGQERFELCQQIKEKLSNCQLEYVQVDNEEQVDRKAIIYENWKSDSDIAKLIVDDNINTFAFYNADIQVLEKMLNMMEE